MCEKNKVDVANNNLADNLTSIIGFEVQCRILHRNDIEIPACELYFTELNIAVRYLDTRMDVISEEYLEHCDKKLLDELLQKNSYGEFCIEAILRFLVRKLQAYDDCQNGKLGPQVLTDNPIQLFADESELKRYRYLTLAIECACRKSVGSKVTKMKV